MDSLTDEQVLSVSEELVNELVASFPDSLDLNGQAVSLLDAKRVYSTAAKIIEVMIYEKGVAGTTVH